MSHKQPPNTPQPSLPCEVVSDASKSIVIQRLIEEVRREKEAPNLNAYNRVYSRHNR